MRRITALLLSVPLAGCAGVSDRRADEIEHRLARIEQKLDSMIEAQSARDDSMPLLDEIDRLEDAGYTDAWPRLKQLKGERWHRLVEAERALQESPPDPAER